MLTPSRTPKAAAKTSMEPAALAEHVRSARAGRYHRLHRAHHDGSPPRCDRGEEFNNDRIRPHPADPLATGPRSSQYAGPSRTFERPRYIWRSGSYRSFGTQSTCSISRLSWRRLSFVCPSLTAATTTPILIFHRPRSHCISVLRGRKRVVVGLWSSAARRGKAFLQNC